MQTTTKRLILAALLSSALAVANAADRNRQPPDFDADGDGCVSQAEFQAKAEARRAEMEARGGGRKPGREPPSFDDLDADGDGCASDAELRAMHERRKGGRGNSRS